LKPLSKQDVTEVLLKLVRKIEENQTHQEIRIIVGDLIQVEKDDEALNYKKQIQEIIDKEMNNPDFSLTELARQINLSTGYLSGLFKTLFGQPFQDYMLNHRLETAKLFILTTDLKNYEIAMQVGFDDVNYFGKRFKLKYGLSPKQYKAKVRSAHEK
jgi:two-component system response regulator YesN